MNQDVKKAKDIEEDNTEEKESKSEEEDSEEKNSKSEEDKSKKTKSKPRIDTATLMLDILVFLKTHTDKENGIDMDILRKRVEKEYDNYNEINRSTFHRTFNKLINYLNAKNLNQIKSSTTINRSGGDIQKGFFYEHTFKQEELYLIIDSILFSKHIPKVQKKDIIKRLEGLTSNHFNSRTDYVPLTSTSTAENSQLFDTIEILLEAMDKNKRVTFFYNDYIVDRNSKLQLGQRKASDGFARLYDMNVYQLVESNGRYYIICNYNKYDGLSNYRVDRITDIMISDEKRKPIRSIKGYEHGLDLAKYMKEHVYLFSGQSARIKMRLRKQALNDFIDWFGTDGIDFSNQTEDEVTVSFHVNLNAMRRWALQYALYATVLSPPELVDGIKKDISIAMKNYE